MTRKILINGRREEELRVAIVENQTLEDFEIECKNSGLLRNNIYRGVVANIAPSLNAAFIDFGDVKNGFLAFNDVVESCYHKPVKDAQRISDVLVVGQPLIVQVIKDATSLKGAQVTTNISLAGRYLVLRPKDAKSGVSRKVDDDQRADLTQKARSLDLPDGYGCIVRTNAIDQSRAILLRDAKILIQLWHKIEAEYARCTVPTLLYNDQDIVLQAMRDYFDSTINEVLVDDKSCYERALSYLKATTDGADSKVKLYEDRMPLFSKYNIERQINQIYARTVTLPSGGFIVIDPTEALTAIDVNSARANKSTSQDQTAYRTNLEAAEEIGRQLRMRDIGGLIVIDFIDMKQSKYQRDVERAMRNAMSRDKARNKVERISANGLLEINRQRISQALSMRTHLECPTCGGRGFIPTVEAMGLNLMREIESRAVQGTISGAIVKLSPENAQTVQNERRHDIVQLEEEYNLRIEILGVREMSRGDEHIQWLTKDEVEALHPSKAIAVSATVLDAADVVEVAEAYNANAQSAAISDSYRPNDFEEYSSEEARKRRANRRARRDNQTACACCDTPVEPQTSIVPETGISAVQKRIGLAILTALLRAAGPHLDDRSNEPRRRMTIRGRRRPHRENGGINMDTCLFSLDVIRAICTLDGVEGDVSRKQLIENVERTAKWLDRAIKSPDEMMSARCAALLAQTNSRHARARLEVLFSGAEPVQSDALGLALCAERDGALHSEDTFTKKTLSNITAAVSKRIADIFGEKLEEPVAATPVDEPPATFDTSALTEAAPATMTRTRKSRLGKRNQTNEQPETQVEAVKPVETPVIVEAAPVEAEVEKVETKQAVAMETPVADAPMTRRRRTHARPAITDTEFFRNSNEVVVADTLIAPMTIINDEDEENDIAQAITQELPAIHDDKVRPARTKRSRHERNKRAPHPIDIAEVDAVEPVEATPAETLTTTPAEAEAVTVPEVITIHTHASQAEHKPSDRRLRRTTPHRPVIEAEPVTEIQKDEVENNSSALSEEISEMFDELTLHAMSKIEEMSVPVEAEPEVVETVVEEAIEPRPMNRRERRSKREPISAAPIIGEIVEVFAEAEKETDNEVQAVQPDETDLDADAQSGSRAHKNHRGHRGGKGRNRNKSAEAIVTNVEAENDAQAMEPVTEAPAVEAEAAHVAESNEVVTEVAQTTDAPARQRRVRRTNARKAINQDAEQVAQPVAAEAPAKAETHVEAKAETHVEAKAETHVEAKAETHVEAKAETHVETKAERASETKSEHTRENRSRQPRRTRPEMRDANVETREAKPETREANVEVHEAKTEQTEAVRDENATTQRETRRVRRTTTKKAADSIESAPAQVAAPQPAEAVAPAQPTAVEQHDAISSDATTETPNRVRRTRRAKLGE